MSDVPVRLLGLCGSTRDGSLNRKLLRLAVREAEALGAEVDVVDLRALGLPIYDGDLEASGFPPAATELKERMGRAAGFLVASPEYNYSIPGGLKNAIDWASRPPRVPFAQKIALLMGTSPSVFGSLRGQLHLRECLTLLNVWVMPQQVLVPMGHRSFSPEGELLQDERKKELTRTVAQLVELARTRTLPPMP